MVMRSSQSGDVDAHQSKINTANESATTLEHELTVPFSTSSPLLTVQPGTHFGKVITGERQFQRYDSENKR
ncbi:hypothetical protein BaRGS_00010367, partial [Batillaria attramentaria]